METPQSAAALQRAAIAAAIQGARTAVGALVDTAADALIAAAETMVAAARDAVADADALTAAEKDAYATTISVIEGNLVAARSRIATARTELRRAMAEEVAKLRPALDDAPISAIAASVEYGTAPTTTGTIPGTPATTVTGLTTAAVEGSASTEGGWTGGAYRAAPVTRAPAAPFGISAGVKHAGCPGLRAPCALGLAPLLAATLAQAVMRHGPGLSASWTHAAGEAFGGNAFITPPPARAFFIGVFVWHVPPFRG